MIGGLRYDGQRLYVNDQAVLLDGEPATVARIYKPGVIEIIGDNMLGLRVNLPEGPQGVVPLSPVEIFRRITLPDSVEVIPDSRATIFEGESAYIEFRIQQVDTREPVSP